MGAPPDFDTFADRAKRLAAAYPAEFMEGIDTVEVHRDARRHPHLPDVYTLGECETSHLSDPTGQEPFRSVVHLYYGSFAALAAEDPHFDVDGELEETLAHEIQHHIEDRAGDRTLRDEDALFEMHARFRSGRDVPSGWYRMGERLEPDLFAVDLDLFLELPMRKAEWARLPGTRLRLELLDTTLELDVPEDADPDEIWTFEGEGLMDDDGAQEEPGDEPLEEGDLLGETENGERIGPVGALHVIPLVR